MVITTKDNHIICTQDNYNSDFWRSVRGKYFTDEPQKDYNYSYVSPIDYEYELDRGILAADYYALDRDDRFLHMILYYADKYNIEVDEKIKTRYKDIRQLCQKVHEPKPITEEEEERNRKHRWEHLQSHGCKDCQNLTYNVDVPYCKASNTALKEENRPAYDEHMVYQLFRYFVPLPNDNCPFKA